MSVDSFAPKIVDVSPYETTVELEGGLTTDVTGTRITVALSNSSPPSAQAIVTSLDNHFGDTQWRDSTRYEHIEPLPESTWTINHGLGREPGSVEVVDNSGSPVLYSLLTHVDLNTIRIVFETPQDGKAYLI